MPRRKAPSTEPPEMVTEAPSGDGVGDGSAQEKSAPRSTPSPSARTARKTPKGLRDIQRGDEDRVHQWLVKPVALSASALIATRNETIAPTEADIETIGRPAERIAMRRLSVDVSGKDATPDTLDFWELAGGLVAYVLRVFSGMGGNRSKGPRASTRMGRSRQTARSDQETDTVSGRDAPVDDGAISPFGSDAATSVAPDAIGASILERYWRDTPKMGDSGSAV